MNNQPQRRGRGGDLAAPLSSSSHPFAAASDQLNSRLAFIEAKLAEDPGRIAWSSAFDRQPLRAIGFGRVDNKWQLSAIFRDPENGDYSRVPDGMSLVEKAEVARAMPVFLAKYRAEQKRRLDLVNEGNKALEQALKFVEGE